MMTKLLVIELDNETSVPRIVYKGKEITHLINLNLDWMTDDYNVQPTYLNIVHVDKNDEDEPSPIKEVGFGEPRWATGGLHTGGLGVVGQELIVDEWVAAGNSLMNIDNDIQLHKGTSVLDK